MLLYLQLLFFFKKLPILMHRLPFQGTGTLGKDQYQNAAKCQLNLQLLSAKCY
ncbi:unnamed protein product [Nezara viridula]|uniref:Uncharacterized protein n=1 Tax=Nezara viridula TaxID=85310 RepID=A0A9P0E8T1_NEZVI|nr:unnamed protein product [Nezara viridula]